MNNQKHESPKVAVLRNVAHGKLASYAKDNTATMRETFLFEDEHYTGVRFTLGRFSFEWKLPDAHASITRGELVVETIGLADDKESRRAA